MIFTAALAALVTATTTAFILLLTAFLAMSVPALPPASAAAPRAGLGLAALLSTTLTSLSLLIDPYRPFLRAFIVARPWLLTLVRMCKFVYGLATNTSEVYRLCAREVDKQAREGRGGVGQGTVSAECIAEIDASILYSKQLSIERRALESPACGLEQVTHMILLKKRFPLAPSASASPSPPSSPALATPASQILFSALSVMHESHRLVAAINARVATKYDRNNKAHERQLLHLWSLLHPRGPALADPRSELWTQIGFQGNDPATDFRGMGVYGLDDLTYLAHTHPHLAGYILKLSHDPIAWFSMAIVGINLSAYVISLLRTRRLQWVLYKYTPTRETVHEVYCWVWVRFVEHWTGQEVPLTIMDFESEFRKVQRRCEEELVLRSVDLERAVGAWDVEGVGGEGWREVKAAADKKVD